MSDLEKWFAVRDANCGVKIYIDGRIDGPNIKFGERVRVIPLDPLVERLEGLELKYGSLNDYNEFGGVIADLTSLIEELKGA